MLRKPSPTFLKAVMGLLIFSSFAVTGCNSNADKKEAPKTDTTKQVMDTAKTKPVVTGNGAMDTANTKPVVTGN